MNKISKAALVMCYFLMSYTAFFFYPKWKQTKTEATISWDASGYYLYLPAIFIYDDIKRCTFKDSMLTKYSPTPDFQQAFLHKASGNYVMKYSSGQAIVMSPFFFAAHVWAKNSNIYLADGFSFPYNICLGIGMFLYALIGLFFLRKILLYYFKDSTVAALLFAYVFGSNYLNYSSIDQAMTHNSLFTIYTLLLFTTIQFYKFPTLVKSMLIGILTGLATLIRPTEIISILIPLCWNISSFKEIKDRFLFIKINSINYILASLFFISIVAIQPLYWKYATGSWIVYSYQDQGFSWFRPHVLNYAFSYRSGWLLFCPMMLFAFVGIIPFIKQRKNLLAVLVFFSLNFYIVTAWDVWDYGGRAMIQSYPILAFPFAALIEKVNQRKYLSYLFYPFFVLFLYLNLWWTFHAHKGNVQVLELTKQYYWRTVGRWNTDDFDKKLLDNKYSFRGYPEKFITFYVNTFDSDTSVNLIAEDSSRKIIIDLSKQYSQEYFIEKQATINKWIRVSADIHCTAKEWNVWQQAQFIIKFYDDEHVIQTNLIRVHRFLDNNETKNIFIDAKQPKNKWNKISAQFWNADGDKTVTIDNLKMITFDN